MQRAPVRPGLVVGAQSGSNQAESETRVRSSDTTDINTSHTIHS